MPAVPKTCLFPHVCSSWCLCRRMQTTWGCQQDGYTDIGNSLDAPPRSICLCTLVSVLMPAALSAFLQMLYMDSITCCYAPLAANNGTIPFTTLLLTSLQCKNRLRQCLPLIVRCNVCIQVMSSGRSSSASGLHESSSGAYN